MRLWSLLLTAILGAALVVACGGNDEDRPDAQAWTGSFCTIAVDFGRANDDIQADIEAAAEDDPAAFKDALLNALDDRIGVIQETRDKVEDLGAPDIDAGDALLDATLARFDRNEDIANDLKARVEALDPADPAFADQVVEAANAIEPPEPYRDTLASIADEEGDRGVDDIIAAIDDNPDCAAVVFEEDGADSEPTTGSTGARVPAAEWVAEVCTIGRDVSALEERVSAELDQSDTVEETYETLLDALHDQDPLLQQLESLLEELGPPDLESGDSIYAAFMERATQSTQFNADVIAALEALDPGSRTFEDDFMAVLERFPDRPPLREELEDIAADEPDARRLLDQFDRDPDCAAFITDDDQEATPSTTATASAVAGPGRGQTAEPEAWSRNVCTAFNDWETRISGALTDLEANEDVSSLTQARDLFVGFLDNVVAETDQLVLDFQNAGIPDVENGSQVANAFAIFIADLSDTFTGVRDRASELPIDDPDAFLAGLDEIQTSLDTDLAESEEILDILDRYNTAELDQLFNTLPECAALSSSSE